MNLVLRTTLIYVFLLLIFRFAGKRTLAQVTPFDLILIVIISQVSQQALLDNDYSLTDAFGVTITIISLELVISLARQKFSRFDTFLGGNPTVIIQNGKLIKERMNNENISKNDILEAVRQEGLENLSQVKYAIMEKNGRISVIPYQQTIMKKPKTSNRKETSTAAG